MGCGVGGGKVEKVSPEDIKGTQCSSQRELHATPVALSATGFAQDPHTPGQGSWPQSTQDGGVRPCGGSEGCPHRGSLFWPSLFILGRRSVNGTVVVF